VGIAVADKSDNWSTPPEETTAAETPTLKRRLPKWAWAAIGLLAAALIAGGVWIAYQSGLSAGQRPRIAFTETTVTVTEVAEAVTETAEPTEPVDDGPTDPAATEEPPPATTDPPQQSVTPPPTLKQTVPPKIQKKYTIPTTWTGVYSAMGHDPWEGPSATSRRATCACIS
jgi:cytoskeletal protein RodZ